MNNKVIFLLPIFIIVLLSSFAFGIDAKANLYRDDVYLFRIKFPVGWEIKDGDGKNVIKKAVDRKSFSSIAISAIKLPGNIDMKDFSQRERDDFLNDSVVSLKEKFSNVRVIEKGIRHLDNKMAIYLKYSFSYRTLDKTVDLMMIQYTTIYKGRSYSVAGGAPKNLFASQEGVINKSIASFVVEEPDYGLKDFSNTNLIAYRDDKFVFEYPKTWSEVPSTHKATKIKIVNENGIGICQ